MGAQIDLNADLGEGMSAESALVPLLTSASVSTGAYTGKEEAVRTTLQLLANSHVVVGMHPGYPDVEHFGRRSLAERFTRETLRAELMQQADQFLSWCAAAKVSCRYLKPHGALYHDVVAHQHVHVAVLGVAAAFGLPVLHQQTLPDVGQVRLYKEGFAERRYNRFGKLVSRTEANAVIESPQEAAQQALELATTVDSLCVHGDAPQAYEVLIAVHKALQQNAWSIQSFIDEDDN